jgi:hypothetical protein
MNGKSDFKYHVPDRVMDKRLMEKNWEIIEEMMNDWCSEMIRIILCSPSSIRVPKYRNQKHITTMTGDFSFRGELNRCFLRHSMAFCGAHASNNHGNRYPPKGPIAVFQKDKNGFPEWIGGQLNPGRFSEKHRKLMNASNRDW